MTTLTSSPSVVKVPPQMGLLENYIDIKNEEFNNLCELFESSCGEIFVFHNKYNENCKYGIICRHCQAKFFNIDLFCDHMISKHVILNQNQSNYDFVNGVAEQKIKNEKDPIKVKSDVESEDDLTLSHYHGRSLKVIKNIKKIKINESNKTKVKQQNHKLHECHICTKSFNRPSKLRSHLIVHDKQNLPKTWQCMTCGDQFDEKKDYRNHREHAHKKIPCFKCNKLFLTQRKLELHMIIHSEIRERVFQCDQCESNYFTKNELNMHIKTVHLNIKNHVCELCNKRFVKRSVLLVHERTHTGEKPFICELCGSCFITQALLVNHKKRHSNERNYECNLCNKKFFSNPALRDHMVTHTKEKAHQCEECNARFSLRSGLNKHKQLHSDIKKYSCNLCGKTFAQNATYYAHKKTHAVETVGFNFLT